MWLDRLAGGPGSASGASTPQSAGRSFSPLPRRTSSNLSPYVTSQRQGHSPRGSSLSLVSSDSSISLLASSRRANGSGLKTSSAIADQTAQSIETLDRLLTGSGDTPNKETSIITQGDLGLEFDFGGLSLKEFATSTSSSSVEKTRRRTEQKNNNDYNEDQAKFEDLHKSIVACDNILNSVETNLASFRDDLAAVSTDIESLQDRSTALNKRLENRREVEKALAPMVEELSISPEIISKIVTGPIDELWAKILNDVDRRSLSYKKKASLETQRSKANEDLGPLLDKLINKAVERIRDFIVAQIKALRSPHINAQIIQQQNFLKLKDLYTFLHKHHQILAEEISQAYLNTMRWYYQTQFMRYEKALGKIKLHILDKTDTIGYEDTSRMTNVLATARAAGPPHDAFNLGRRMDILKANNQPALSSYLAEEDKSTHYIETTFRNFNLALVDNATAEYTFLATYFTPSTSFAQIGRNFNYIFDPVFELGRNLSKTLVGETFDAIGILLCIRLNQHLAFELQRRRVPTADGYINGTNMLLWPRFQVIMDRHLESVKQLANSVPSKPAKSASDLAKMSAAPHMATQRFGQLLHAFLSLSTDAGDDEPVMASLQRLRTEIEAFLTRVSNSYGSDRRKSARFMYNNYSLILTIIGDTRGKLAEEQQEHFEQLKEAYKEDD